MAMKRKYEIKEQFASKKLKTATIKRNRPSAVSDDRCKRTKLSEQGSEETVFSTSSASGAEEGSVTDDSTSGEEENVAADGSLSKSTNFNFNSSYETKSCGQFVISRNASTISISRRCAQSSSRASTTGYSIGAHDNTTNSYVSDDQIDDDNDMDENIILFELVAKVVAYIITALFEIIVRKLLQLTDQQQELKQRQQRSLAAEERGNAAYREEQYLEAIDAYQEAVELDSTNAIFYNNLAAAYLKISVADKAMEAIERSLELDKYCAKAWAKKGDIGLFTKNYHMSISSYTAGLHIEPDNVLCKQGLDAATSALTQDLNLSEIKFVSAFIGERCRIINESIEREDDVVTLKRLLDDQDRNSKAFESFVVLNNNVFGWNGTQSCKELVAIREKEDGNEVTKLIEDPVPRLVELRRRDIDIVERAFGVQLNQNLNGIHYSYELKQRPMHIEGDEKLGIVLYSVYHIQGFLYGVDEEGMIHLLRCVPSAYAVASIVQFLSAYTLGFVLTTIILDLKLTDLLTESIISTICFIVVGLIWLSHFLNYFRNCEIAISNLSIEHEQIFSHGNANYESFLHSITNAEGAYPEAIYATQSCLGYKIHTLHSRYANYHAVYIQIFGFFFRICLSQAC